MIEVLSNTLTGDQKERLESEVLAALGERPEGEDWEVSLLGSQKLPRIVVFIRRAKGGFRGAWVFDEQREAVRTTIESSLRDAGY
jgi:hypothetical protein